MERSDAVQRRLQHLAVALGSPYRSEPGQLAPASCSASSSRRVCVLGAGVVGLTTALQLLQDLPGVRVHVVAEKYGDDTLTAGAGGLWMPYALGTRPLDGIDRLMEEINCLFLIQSMLMQ